MIIIIIIIIVLIIIPTSHTSNNTSNIYNKITSILLPQYNSIKTRRGMRGINITITTVMQNTILLSPNNNINHNLITTLIATINVYAVDALNIN